MAFPVAILAELALSIGSKAYDKYTAKKEMEKAIKADPVLKNAMSEEAPLQSRVTIGATVAAIGVLLPTVAGLFGFDFTETDVVRHVDAGMVLWGSLYALYGRWWPGLKPLGG